MDKDKQTIEAIQKSGTTVTDVINELREHIVHLNIILEEINRENNDTIEISKNIKYHIDNVPGMLFIDPPKEGDLV